MRIIPIIFFCFLTSCSLAPTYQRPPINTAPKFKESGKWLKAKPATATLSRGNWWEMYHDNDLNTLEKQICFNNEDLKAAIARFESARSAAIVARSAFFPTILSVLTGNRQGTSNTVASPNSPLTYNDTMVGLDLSYEIDVWGKIRNSVTAANQRMKASAADAASINLSLQAELAANYFSLRAADALQVMLDKTVFIYKQGLKLTEDRYHGGASPIGDVYQAKVQYENAKTLAADNHMKRAQLEHAIAILIGRIPANFCLPPAVKSFNWVEVSPNLPSTLLERRPDIAAAELRVEAANANIGVARAAYFPDFNLSLGIGFESQNFKNLFQGDSLIWALGPSGALAGLTSIRAPMINYTVFDGGRIAGLTRQAWANYHESVATYRQTVLRAFQDVEDNLVAIRQLNKQNTTQQLATTAAINSLNQASYRYKGGVTNYLEVIVSENLALQAQIAFINLQAQRQIASVQLIKALGGGWKAC